MICKYLLPFCRFAFLFLWRLPLLCRSFFLWRSPTGYFSFYFPCFWRKIHKIITKTEVHEVLAYVVVLFTLEPHRTSTATGKQQYVKQNNTQNIWQQHGTGTNQMEWMAAVNNQYPWVLQFLVMKKITLHSCRLLELQDNILNLSLAPVPG